MPLVVENGSGVAGANSYVSVEYATTYFAARGLVFDDYEHKLLQAMDTIETLKFAGTKTSSSNALSFPRKGVTDKEGAKIPESSVPGSLVKAQLWLAHYINAGANPGSLATPAVKREKVDVLETEYAVSDAGTKALTVFDLPNVYTALKHLLANTGETQWCGRTVRA